MRKMATLRYIDDIQAIPCADNIEVATIGGWRVVVNKNQYCANEMVIYCEVDSWIPHDIAPFLTKGEPKEYNGVAGNRLRTIKLRGQISQGLVLPTHLIGGGLLGYVEGDDVSAVLGIEKWEPPINPQLGGSPKGNFPWFIPKTDQERVQNLKGRVRDWSEQGLEWEVTEKLDGSSMTVFIRDGVVGVCSRNLELNEDDNNTFWKVAKEQGIIEYLNGLGTNIALQGELIGEGVQGNPYNIRGHKFYLYDVWDIDKQKYLAKDGRHIHGDYIGHVPVIGYETLEGSIDNLLTKAEGISKLYNTQREGLVYKCLTDPSLSFKVISNKWLLKEK